MKTKKKLSLAKQTLQKLKQRTGVQTGVSGGACTGVCGGSTY